MNKPIIMGRRTYQSIGRPLPGRTNIVVSLTINKVSAGFILRKNLQAALAYAEEDLKEKLRKRSISKKDCEIMIIGGGDIYKQVMGKADRLLITEVQTREKGDTHFPEYRYNSDWQEEREEEFRDGKYDCIFREIKRIVPE